MLVNNLTCHDIEHLLNAALEDFDHSDITVEIKYSPAGSRRIISGTYYRWTPKAPDGRLIRLRINRTNKYPVKVPFKTSDYYTKKDAKGRDVVYQKFRVEKFTCAEHLLLAIFLHEFSHYLDHAEGRNGRYKQTKADRFAVERLVSLGLIRP